MGLAARGADGKSLRAGWEVWGRAQWEGLLYLLALQLGEQKTQPALQDLPRLLGPIGLLQAGIREGIAFPGAGGFPINRLQFRRGNSSLWMLGQDPELGMLAVLHTRPMQRDVANRLFSQQCWRAGPADLHLPAPLLEQAAARRPPARPAGAAARPTALPGAGPKTPAEPSKNPPAALCPGLAAGTGPGMRFLSAHLALSEQVVLHPLSGAQFRPYLTWEQAAASWHHK